MNAADIDHVRVATYVVPTDAPESDGTFAWTSTTVVVCEITAGGVTGLGHSYAARAAAAFAEDILSPVLMGRNALDTHALWNSMRAACRNNGMSGVSSAAVSALDIALWDLKGRLLNASVATLLGAARDAVPAYGSGGFTSYSIPELQRRLADWVRHGLRCVKMKVGRVARDDIARVRAAREAIGPDAELFVDANGAYSRSVSLDQAARFAEQQVTWFEEPVSSDDVEGLALLVDRAPAGMAIAAGEYAYTVYDFRRLLEARAVGVLQADATRCGGITGFLKAAAIAEAWNTPVSAHTAPSVHAQVCSALANVVHIEYLHDHSRIEQLFFDGAARPRDGALHADRSRPGVGLELKRADAEPYRIA
jgi:L-alanine-DL-glutamate epimerase-like enolase superfamily enzyme